MPKTALIAVDVQNDYLPKGALGFPESDCIIESLVEYATLAADITICSRNLRPPDHASFNLERAPGDPIYLASEHGGDWAMNCVKGTPGARIVADLASIVAKPSNYVVTKSLQRTQGGFSAFEGGTLRPLESLEDILYREQITHVTVGGYWLDWAVAQTAFDASALGYQTAIDKQCTVPFIETPERTERIVKHLEHAGIPLV